MIDIKTLLMVLAVNITGLLLILLIPHAAIALGRYPAIEDAAARALMQRWVYGGSALVLIVCAALSLGGLFVKRPMRMVFFAAPVCLPALFMVRMLAWFAAG